VIDAVRIGQADIGFVPQNTPVVPMDKPEILASINALIDDRSGCVMP
jgi:hypothetical protein